MHEVFYVESGKGVFMVDDMPHVVGDGSFVHVSLCVFVLECQ